MKITLIGCGCGPESLTAAGKAAMAASDLLIGAPRLLEAFPGLQARVAARTAQEILSAVSSSGAGNISVLFSGDSGFFSGTRLLLPHLQQYDWAVIPGISSLQLLSARLGEAWQNWRLCSAHGVDCDPVAEVCHGRRVFFLTGGEQDPSSLCQALSQAGLGNLSVTVAEDLGTPQERIRSASAEAFSAERFSSLSVMLADAAPRLPQRVPGLPDTLFERAEGIPMTKREIRAAALSFLEVGPEDCCWDIGTGTGSVAIELALQASSVWSLDHSEAALRIAAQNREKLGAWNLHLIAGSAPDALRGLPTPDVVFIGGSDGNLEGILRFVHAAAPGARICISAIALESLNTAVHIMRSLNRRVEVSQLSVSRSRSTGSLTLMLAQNPVFLILGLPQ